MVIPWTEPDMMVFRYNTYLFNIIPLFDSNVNIINEIEVKFRKTIDKTEHTEYN